MEIDKTIKNSYILEKNDEEVYFNILLPVFYAFLIFFI